MEELTNADLKLLFKEDIYLIKDNDFKEPVPEKPKTETLIKEDVSAPSVVEEPIAEAISLNYKGANAKGIAIIINDDSNEFLNPTDETLLLNILKALGFSLEDVAIINQHTAGTKWTTQIDFSKVIVFGILPSTYGVTSSNYTIEEKEGAKWLFSDSLFSLNSNKVLKGKLWTTLQEFFK